MYFSKDGALFERWVCPQEYLVPEGFEFEDLPRKLRYEPPCS